MIVREGQIYAAGCILPLTKNEGVDDNLGTRHRAALGISELTDCISLIVSEETGTISLARDGELTRFADQPTITSELLKSQDKEMVKGSKIFKKGSDRDVEE